MIWSVSVFIHLSVPLGRLDALAFLIIILCLSHVIAEQVASRISPGAVSPTCYVDRSKCK
jgi:hypothetical protein